MGNWLTSLSVACTLRQYGHWKSENPTMVTGAAARAAPR